MESGIENGVLGVFRWLNCIAWFATFLRSDSDSIIGPNRKEQVIVIFHDPQHPPMLVTDDTGDWL